jgi:predicted RNase H-like nuclease (RuvC/YqgF family)
MIKEMEAIFEDRVKLKELVKDMTGNNVHEEALETLKREKKEAEFIHAQQMEELEISKQIVVQELEELKAKKQSCDNEMKSLKASVMNLSLEVFELKNQETVNKTAKQEDDGTIEKVKKLQEQIAVLKLDLADKCKEYEKLSNEYKTFKLQVENHECFKNKQPKLTENALKLYTGPAVVPSQVIDLSNRLNDLANRYNIVVNDRNQLWTQHCASER